MMNIKLIPIIMTMSIICTYVYADELPSKNEPKDDVLVVRSEKTFTQAQIEINIENIYSEVKTGKYERAELLFLAAKRGYANACLYVGYMFDNGIRVAKNSDKAFLWFKSCATKHPLVAYNLAVLYAEGRGTTADMNLAVKYFIASWPTLKTLVPQTPVRLAYYYYKKKMWHEAWEWAQNASQIANNKKHGDFLIAKMIAEGTAPQAEEITVAITKAQNSMIAGNPQGAELLAWIYATKLPNESNDSKNRQLACSYEKIANLISNAHKLETYCSGLSTESKIQAEEFAKTMMFHQKKPVPMDFKSTLDGKEAQFTHHYL